MRTTIFALLIGFAGASALAAEPDTHREAAREIYHLTSPRETFISNFCEVFKIQLKQLAEQGIEESKIDQIQKASATYAEAIVDDPEFEKRMVSIYVETFTEPEIQELIRFYRTPTGKKALLKMPELFQKGGKVGQELAEKHQPEFQKAVQSILAKDPS